MTERLKRLEKQIGEVLVGREEVTKLILTGLLAGGHILLEDMPGTGKTMLAKTLAASLGAEFSRIQFTPDLLPSDVTGIHFYRPDKGEFELKKGPVFTQILLADEINRATPRTQAALLECMEERQVSLDGETIKLPELFFVIATQNPVETSGTFPLPEAQLDRFSMKLSMGEITAEEEIAMLNRFEHDEPQAKLSPVMAAEEITAVQKEIREVFVHDELKTYIVELCRKTRQLPGVLAGVSGRAVLNLMRCAKAYAYLSDRAYVTPEDIYKLAPCCLAHRLVMRASLNRQLTENDIIKEVLSEVAVPTENWR